MANLVMKPTPPLTLKDYLRDELSSCSSHGFRSFPRRQCCTVRFLIEIDLKTKHSVHSDHSSIAKKLLHPSVSRKFGFTTISAAIVKSLQKLRFSSGEKGILRRSFSRKLSLRTFWKKVDMAEPKIGRWKSFRDFLDEREEPLDNSGRNSTGGCSNSDGCTEREFTSEMTVLSLSGGLASLVENDVVKSEEDSPGQPVNEREGVTEGKDALTTCPERITKQWPSEEEKEQFSPVSVLDCPFDDEDGDHISSSFNSSLYLTGKRQKHLQKMKRFHSKTPLEPLDLKKRFADLELHDHGFTLLSTQEHQREEKAYDLLKLLKSSTKTTPHCFISKAENLLLDFFHEKLEESEERTRSKRADFEAQILKLTEDWIDGEGEEMMELQKDWSLCVEEMEKGGKWRDYKDEKEELAFMFEAEVWSSLLNELLIELS